MKIVSIQNVKARAGKILLGLAAAALLAGVSAVPASCEERGRGERQDNGRYEQRGRGHDNNRYYYRNGRRYDRTPVYRERVYVAPPPIIYAPPEPPGLSIFLPPLRIRL
jgi:hypothetical protein